MGISPQLRRGLWTGLLILALLLWPAGVSAQVWEGKVRGSWVRDGEPEPGDVVLVEPGRVCQIVLADDAHSAVRQAATFLRSDLAALTGAEVEIVNAPVDGRVSIHLVTLGDGAELPAGIQQDQLEGQWEAYQILTTGDAVWLVGSNPRGTAFAVYTLSERLGIDPLYLWTGYTPKQRPRLVLRQTDHFVPPPTFKYRGMFHDDEDILPRPFEDSGYPLRIGDVPLAWYKRFFETALRLRMNMVAPYTRTHRRFEVQKTASDWGLFYTSHHYDILLSNPFGYRRFRLAEKRGVSGDWNWYTNADNMLRYWRAGVEENGQLDAIWPVGLRGTDDYAYPFPEGASPQEQNRVFREVIDAQIRMTRELLPPGRQPVFHFTLYGEMLDKYLAGSFDMPSDVIIVWPDDNDGRMRALPGNPGRWKHGVYYHLAYYGPVAKQSMHVVPPARVAHEFRKIVDAGATQFMLLNVSELREFIREARMIAEICWDAPTALADTSAQPMPDHILPHVPSAKNPPPPDAPSLSADRFVRWWSAEYFGERVADRVAEIYRRYDALLDRWDRQWYASDKVEGALDSLIRKFAGEPFPPAAADTLPTLKARDERYREVFELIDAVRAELNPMQQQLFFEHVELPLRVTWRHTQAAILLVEAMAEPSLDRAWAMCQEAMKPLEQMEIEILRAERPPFERWYAKTFIRHEHTGLNLHRPYESLRAFLSSGGKRKTDWPEAYRRPDLDRFLPVLKDGE
ncbi:MAG TPA: glycosyl hydrolase 115 family protein [Phycisphaeraceae bacterium]